jgi:hypothetical protein
VASILTDAISCSVYELPDYLSASARHVGAELELATAGGACLPLLLLPDGSRRTVYGLPRPYGDDRPEAVEALAASLADDPAALTAILSPLSPGPELAHALVRRGGRLTGERPIAVAELDEHDPAEQFDRRARRAIATAAKRGAGTAIGPLALWFGEFYRQAMAAIGAERIFFFGDEYFASLASPSHYVVTVSDEHGIAAATLFLCEGNEAYYHLGGRRTAPEPVLGAMSVALGEGIREAWRRGLHRAVLGGGRTDDALDPLFTFKRQLATAAPARLTVELGGNPR